MLPVRPRSEGFMPLINQHGADLESRNFNSLLPASMQSASGSRRGQLGCPGDVSRAQRHHGVISAEESATFEGTPTRTPIARKAAMVTSMNTRRNNNFRRSGRRSGRVECEMAPRIALRLIFTLKSSRDVLAWPDSRFVLYTINSPT